MSKRVVLIQQSGSTVRPVFKINLAGWEHVLDEDPPYRKALDWAPIVLAAIAAVTFIATMLRG